jgi:hypothetical protein
MNRLRNLGLAWLALGFVELAWVAFCVFGGLVLGLVGFGDRELQPMWVLSGAYGLLAVFNLPIAALHVLTGVRLRQGRGLLLLIASIAAALMSLISALYCSPLALAVIVYAIVVLADPEAREILDPRVVTA